MKCFDLIVIFVLFVSVASSYPIQNGMMFYQQRPVYYTHRQPYPSQHAMLLHYGPANLARRSAQGNEVTAFAAGDTIGAGSYINEESPINVPEPEQPVLLDDSGNTYSVAEAYPESYDLPTYIADELPAVQNDVSQEEVNPQLDVQQDNAPKKKGPKEITPTILSAPVPEENESPVAVAPVKPPKKKVHIELDEHDGEEDEDYVPYKKRPSKNGGEQQWPPNTFFPMNFGSTSGGAIAVANSFSTGKGGTATSHATAYGAPSRLKEKKRHVST